MATGVDLKMLKSTKFPPEFNLKVDMQKVNREVMKQSVTPNSDLPAGMANAHTRWIVGKISDILGNEDDVVTELCYNLMDTRYVRLDWNHRWSM